MEERARDVRTIPEIVTPRPPLAEIQVQPRRLVVTVPLNELGIEKPLIVLTRTALRLGSPDDVFRREFVIPLPVPVDPRQYRASIRNGILDLVAARSKP